MPSPPKYIETGLDEVSKAIKKAEDLFKKAKSKSYFRNLSEDEREDYITRARTEIAKLLPLLTKLKPDIEYPGPIETNKQIKSNYIKYHDCVLKVNALMASMLEVSKPYQPLLYDAERRRKVFYGMVQQDVQFRKTPDHPSVLLQKSIVELNYANAFFKPTDPRFQKDPLNAILNACKKLNNALSTINYLDALDPDMKRKMPFMKYQSVIQESYNTFMKIKMFMNANLKIFNQDKYKNFREEFEKLFNQEVVSKLRNAIVTKDQPAPAPEKQLQLNEKIIRDDDVDIPANTHMATKTGYKEITGRRDSQEDSIAINFIPGFEHVPDTKVVVETTTEQERHKTVSLREAVLMNTVKELEQKLETELPSAHSRRSGSTLCANVICGDKIYTANVGDSTAFLVTVDGNGKATLKRLNDLHNPQYIKGNESKNKETTRLERIGKADHIQKDELGKGRLNGLAVSRAMGDTRLDDAGLSHEAETSVQQVTIPEGGKAFLICACDGLTEGVDPGYSGGGLTDRQIEEVVERNYRKPNALADITQQLVSEAYRGKGASDVGSTDNISVMITQIEPHNMTPKYLSVFDGHGGNRVSSYLGNHFHEVLQQNVDKTLANIYRVDAAPVDEPGVAHRYRP